VRLWAVRFVRLGVTLSKQDAIVFVEGQPVCIRRVLGIIRSIVGSLSVMTP